MSGWGGQQSREVHPWGGIGKGCSQQAGQGHLSYWKGATKFGLRNEAWAAGTANRGLRCQGGWSADGTSRGCSVPGRPNQAERH